MATEDFELEENQQVQARTKTSFSWRKGILAVACVGLVSCVVAVALTLSGGNLNAQLSVTQPKDDDHDKIESQDGVRRQSSSKDNIGGIESPYRYDCNSVDCTPLDEYVWRDNKDYSYKTVAVYDHRLALKATRTLIVNMTSQNWLTEADVTRTLWYHELVICIPYNYDPDMPRSGLMLIDGGSNKGDRILDEDETAVKGCQIAAKSLRTIVAILRQIPNERLYFHNDPRLGEQGRSEDDIIAWTWKHFLHHPDEPDWLLRMPMTKAARLALDTIDSVFKENRLEMGLSHMRSPIDNFLVTGASKRGWTTWTLSAVDKRVKASVPMVLDCLNMETLFLQWFQNNGAWSFALAPYWDEGLTANFSAPEFRQMAKIIDPFYYRERLTMPKMVISATGDEFFAPDDSYAWFNDMKGPTYLRHLPNAEHGMIPPQALSSPSIVLSIRAFYLSVMKKYTLPNVSWERGVAEDGRAWVKVKTSKYPSMINGWTADTRNSTRRDFRWARLKTEAVDWPTNDHSKASGKRVDDADITLQPIKWNRLSAFPEDEMEWMVSVPASYDGFRALMIEVSFPGPDDKSKLTFTTEIMITPDSRPFEPCSGMDCLSYLL